MEIPDYKMVQGGNTRVNMRSTYMGQDASGIGKAFANMGKDLEGAGMQVAGMFEELERQHDAGKMADLQLELDQTMSQYQQTMAENPNNALKWREGFDEVIEKKRSEIASRDMSSGLREKVNRYVDTFHGKKGIEVSNITSQTILGNARKSAEARIMDLRERGEDEAAMRQVKEDVENGLMASARGEELILGMERQAITREWDRQLEANPQKFLQKLEDGKIKGKQEDISAMKVKAKRAVAVEKMDNIDDVKNLIDGSQVKDSGELAKIMRARGFDDTSAYHMHSYFDTRNSEVLKKFYASPAQQERLYGKARAMLADYNPTGDTSDQGYARIMSTIDKIADSPYKQEVIKELNAKREGAEEVRAKHEDFMKETVEREAKLKLDEHMKKKPATIKRTVQYHIMKGFLKDRANLTPYFTDDDVIDDIVNADDGERIALFKEHFKNDQKYQGFTEFQQRMAWAIKGGRLSSVVSSYEDKAAGDAWQKELSKIHTQNGKASLDIFKRTQAGEFRDMPLDKMNKLSADASLFQDPKAMFDSLSPIAPITQPTSKYEARFADAYSKYAQANNLDMNPDSYKHYYDYRAAYDETGLRTDEDGHLPSKFKREGHPRLYMSPDGVYSSTRKKGWTDTRDGSIVGEKKEKPVLTTELSSFVKKLEGFNEQAYDDYKQTSIGYGTRARKGETTISEAEAEARLADELKDSRAHVMEINKKYGYDFTENQIIALTSFAYNIGSLNELTKNGNRTKAKISEMMLAYNKAGGETLEGLKNRRKAEQDLFNK